MATLTLTLTEICSGGNHLTFEVSGDRQTSIVTDIRSLDEPLDQDDAAAFIRIITKMARAGRTRQQARALLEAGVTVTV